MFQSRHEDICHYCRQSVFAYSRGLGCVMLPGFVQICNDIGQAHLSHDDTPFQNTQTSFSMPFWNKMDLFSVMEV